MGIDSSVGWTAATKSQGNDDLRQPGCGDDGSKVSATYQVTEGYWTELPTTDHVLGAI